MTPITAAWLGLAWILGWLLGWTKRMPSSTPAVVPADEGPSVSIVIPARNEELRLRTLFATLDIDGLDVVVVDDESADDTSAVARAAGARVVRVTAEPGWTGKAWACWAGAQAAGGEVVVFLDADTSPHRSAVDALERCAASTGGLVSVQPEHTTVRSYEQLSAMPNLVAAMGAGTGHLAKRTWWRGPAAFGMAMAIPRTGYLEAGGHRTRRAAVADDLALAQTVHAAGLPVSAWCGGVDLSVRMYGEGVGGLARGWVKNLSAGARSIPPLRTAAVALWIAALVRACIGLTDVVVGTGAGRWIALTWYAAFAVQVTTLARRIGTFAWASLLALPVLAGAFLCFFAASVFGTIVRRDVPWRGRNVRIGAVP